MTSRLWQTIDEDLSAIKLPDLDWGDNCFMLVYGSAGAGKTTLGRWYAQQWGPGTMVTAAEFFNHLRDHCQTSRDAGFNIDILNYTPRLVIDDLGYEAPDVINIRGTQYDPRRIIAHAIFIRHSRKLRTLITSNVGMEKLASFYDQTETERGRFHSRMRGCSTIYLLKGDRRKNETVTWEEVSRGTKDKCPVPLLGSLDPEDAERKHEMTVTECNKAIKSMTEQKERMPASAHILDKWIEELERCRAKAQKRSKG